ncbi:MAG: hypothetical protein KGL39_44885 [Patescibacteria group bacterium]|nr:hypothetical protein [Patescibacteria group bacterium]
MSNLPTILRRAAATCDRDPTCCAHIAINDATHEHHDLYRPALEAFAQAAGVTLDPPHAECNGLRPLHRWWDAASVGGRKIFDQAIADTGAA